MSATQPPGDPLSPDEFLAGVFVPEGHKPPPHVLEPGWFKVPATFVPRGGGRRMPSGAPWPKDSKGRDWPKDRWGRPMRPLWDYPPGVRAPGEGPVEPPKLLDTDAAVAHALWVLAAATDPSAALRILQYTNAVAAGAAGRGRANYSSSLDEQCSGTGDYGAESLPKAMVAGSKFEASTPRTLSGNATFYSLPGQRTATGRLFDPDSMVAAMRSDKVRPGTKVRVQLRDDPSRYVDVTIDDTGPFERGPDGRAVRPLPPDPSIVIDLTPRAFQALTGDMSLGRVHVIVTIPAPP
jgi:hypothetical protein